MESKDPQPKSREPMPSSLVFLLIACLAVPFLMGPGNNPATAADPANCVGYLFKVGSPHPANPAFPEPTVDVNCTSGTVTVRSNGIPDYEFKQITPNSLQG